MYVCNNHILRHTMPYTYYDILYIQYIFQYMQTLFMVYVVRLNLDWMLRNYILRNIQYIPGNIFEGDEEMMIASLQKIVDLPESTFIFPGL